MIAKALRLLAGIVVFLAGIALLFIDLRGDHFKEHIVSCMGDVMRANNSNRLLSHDELTLNYIRGCMKISGTRSILSAKATPSTV